MISKRAVILSAVAIAAPLFVSSGAAVGVADPCLVAPPQLTPGAWTINGVSGITGSPGNDQIIGTENADTLYGLEGHDVIKGMGGDDIICGGAGNDGLNGGGGADTIGGGADEDLIMGHDMGDAIWGGAGRDGIYGGYGADTITSSDDGTTPDYVVGGTGDPDSITSNNDVEFPDEGGNVTSCPSNDSVRWQGVYGTHDRLPVRLSDNVCRTFTGTVTQANNTTDGDRHFKLLNSGGTVIQVDDADGPGGKRDLVIELMPRDQQVLESLPNGASVTIFGLYVTDAGHQDTTKPEIHPIYQITVNGTTHNLGPKLGGSPYRMSPATLFGTTTELRFCWDQTGRPCRPYDNTANAKQFNLHDTLVDATHELADEADRTYS